MIKFNWRQVLFLQIRLLWDPSVKENGFLSFTYTEGTQIYRLQVNFYVTNTFYPEHSLLSKGEIIFQWPLGIWNAPLWWHGTYTLYDNGLNATGFLPLQLSWYSSNPNHWMKLFILDLFLSLGYLAAEFTSSAACFELRSASSLCADGAWDLQASWYWNFLRICA